MSSSVYTPSVLPHAQLEELFVARHDVLDQIAQRVDSAGSTPSRNHTLLVGPRGAGKTHLVSLAFHRLAARIADGLNVRASWLPEDPWTITSYARLLRAVLIEEIGARTDGVDGFSVDECEALLKSRARDAVLVVFAENFDQILEGIGSLGQQKLRHLAQSGAILFVVTTTSLSRAITAQDSPFYGFFTETRLAPLDVDSATDLLALLADQRGDTENAERLRSGKDRTKLEVVAHLTGGQPRIWSILADALSIEGTVSATDALLATFDRLTPYYQEQLARLSPNQRLIVGALAEADRAMTVRDLAASTEIDQRSLSRTLVELRDRSWVQEVESPALAQLKDKRVTYYELAEPLARVVFQIKATKNGEPLRLLIDFLLLWFPAMSVPADGATPSLVHELEVIRSLLGEVVSMADEHVLLGALDAIIALKQGDPTVLLGLSHALRSSLEAAIRASDLDRVGFRLGIVALYAADVSVSALHTRMVSFPNASWYFAPILLARSGRYRHAASVATDNIGLAAVPMANQAADFCKFFDSFVDEFGSGACSALDLALWEISLVGARLEVVHPPAGECLSSQYRDAIRLGLDCFYSQSETRAMWVKRLSDAGIDIAALDRSLYDAELPPPWAKP